MRQRIWFSAGVLAGIAMLAALGLYGRTAFADHIGRLPNAQEGTFQTDVFTSSQANISGFGIGNKLYGFRVHATSANAECGLYDVATLGLATTTQGIFIDEGGAATQYNDSDSAWAAPYSIKTALTVVVTNGACIVYHDVR